MHRNSHSYLECNSWFRWSLGPPLYFYRSWRAHLAWLSRCFSGCRFFCRCRKQIELLLHHLSRHFHLDKLLFSFCAWVSCWVSCARNHRRCSTRCTYYLRGVCCGDDLTLVFSLELAVGFFLFQFCCNALWIFRTQGHWAPPGLASRSQAQCQIHYLPSYCSKPACSETKLFCVLDGSCPLAYCKSSYEALYRARNPEETRFHCQSQSLRSPLSLLKPVVLFWNDSEGTQLLLSSEKWWWRRE